MSSSVPPRAIPLSPLARCGRDARQDYIRKLSERVFRRNGGIEMSTISLRLPDYLHDMLRELAQDEQVSINQLIVLAIAEKISALNTEGYLEKRAVRGNRAKFEAAMSKVPDVEPEEYDRL
jgi:predicted HicB family RNase H-like nuclease